MSSEKFEYDKVLPNTAIRGYDSEFDVVRFLDKYKCPILGMRFGGDLPSTIIDKYASKHDINQRIILLTLQKEQCLIENGTGAPVTQQRLDWACGCGKFDDGTELTPYRGFGNQIRGACSTYSHWYDKWKDYKDVAFECIDGDKVLCKNGSTYALYNYTPRIDAQKGVWDIWKRYFPEYVW